MSLYKVEGYGVFSHYPDWVNEVKRLHCEVQKELDLYPTERYPATVFFGDKYKGTVMFGTKCTLIYVPYDTFILKHELTHVLIRDVYGDVAPYIHEGYASRYDTVADRVRMQKVFDSMLKNRCIPKLSDAINKTLEPDDIAGYAVACRMVSWLESKFGRDKTFKYGQTRDVRVLGYSTPDQLDKDWYDSLGQ